MTDTDMGGMCECEYGDGEPIVTFEHRNLKGRKDYSCSECGRVIKEGELHEFWRFLCDGKFYRERTCLQCVAISDDFCCGQRGIACIFQETYGWDYREIPKGKSDD